MWWLYKLAVETFMYDVLIIGGGPAGMASALTLSRGRRRVLLCDDDRPRNAPAKKMQNFPSREGTPPLEFLKMVRSDLEKYPTLQLVKDTVTSAVRTPQGFSAQLKSGRQVEARKLIIAAGVKDELPTIPGVAQLWGKSVVHCTYCHGFEHKDEALGLLIDNDKLFLALPLVLGISKDVILFTDGQYKFTADQMALIKKNKIPFFEEKILSFKHNEDKLTGIELADGSVIPRNVFFMKPPMRPKSDVGEQLGCRINEMGLYQVDPTGRSTEEGIFVAGDLNDMRQSVLIASASGSLAAIAVNLELLTEDFNQGQFGN